MKEVIILIITIGIASVTYIALNRKKNYGRKVTIFQKRDSGKRKTSSWFQQFFEDRKEVQEEKKQEQKEKEFREVKKVIKENSIATPIRKDNSLVLKQKLVEDYLEVCQKCIEYKEEEKYDKLLLAILPLIQQYLGFVHYVLPSRDLGAVAQELTLLVKETLTKKIMESGFLLNSSGKFVLASMDTVIERTRLLQMREEELKERLKAKRAEVATIHRYSEMKKICKDSAQWLYRLQNICDKITVREDIVEAYRAEFHDISAMLERIFEQNGFEFLYYEDLEEESKIAKSFRNFDDCKFSYPALCKKVDRIGYQVFLNYSGCKK